MAPSFSVVLCNYNDAGYLPSALSSILEQDGPPDQILLVDDASTDGSLAVMEAWASRHPQIEIVRNPINLGPIAAANLVLPRVAGDYVAWWSADDQLKPAMLAQVRSAVVDHPTAAVIATRTEVAREGTSVIKVHDFGFSQQLRFFDPDAFIRASRRRYFWMGSSGLFLSTETLRTLGGWIPAFDWFADWYAVYAGALSGGAVLINHVGSRVLERPASFGARVRADEPRRRRAIVKFLDYLGRPENQLMRRRFIDAGLIMPYALGSSLFKEMAHKRRDWDMLLMVGLAWCRHRVEVKINDGLPLTLTS